MVAPPARGATIKLVPRPTTGSFEAHPAAVAQHPHLSFAAWQVRHVGAQIAAGAMRIYEGAKGIRDFIQERLDVIGHVVRRILPASSVTRSIHIKHSDGAIGYVEYAFALRLGLPMARLQNKAGRYVGPERSDGAGGAGEQRQADAGESPAVPARPGRRELLSHRLVQLAAALRPLSGST